MAGLGIVSKSKVHVTVENLKQTFPGKRSTITQDTADMINESMADPMFNGEDFLVQMNTFRNVMDDNSSSIREYVNALKFCAYLEAENDNYTEAYKRARCADEFVLERMDAPTDSAQYRELTYAASRYRKGKLVKQILTQSDMPLYLMFQGARFEAVSQLAKEMINAPYSKDRITAADKLLTHVKPPETALQVDMNIGMTSDAKDVTMQLNEQLAVLAGNQRKMLEQGYKIGEVQSLNMAANSIEAEIVE